MPQKRKKRTDPEEIDTLNTYEGGEQRPLLRIGIITILIMVAYTVIALRLWDLQVFSGRKYTEKASRQYARQIRIPAVRGRILSSDRRLLAGNRASYDVVFHISEMQQPGKRSKTVKYIYAQAQLAMRIIGRPMEITEKDIIHRMTVYPGIPMTICQDLSMQELARISELQPPVHGLQVVPSPRRVYPHGNFAAHLIGYTGTSDPGTAEDRREFFYYLPDPVGRSGVEKACDEALRGSPGKKLVIVDHKGFVRKEMDEKIPAENGSDVILTLDFRAQMIAERLLAGKSGAIVLLDAEDGSIIAMASSPRYDLNLFIPRIPSRVYQRLLYHKGVPFLNRAAAGAYMPGSIIKPIVSLALLENGRNPEEENLCDGATEIGDSVIKCAAWRRGGHGKLNLLRAIELSCNDYFIEGGLSLGISRLSGMFRSAGIGRKTGFLLSERAGFLPVPGMKHWTKHDTALVSIGQGRIEVTPLQAALYTAAIANGGTLYKPIIVRKIVEENGKEIFSAVPEVKGKLAASEKALSYVRQGMYQAVHSSMGSAVRALNPAIVLYGKTGTAEVGPKNNRYKNTWFTGFGTDPAANKKYAITILVNHGESGGKSCAPLAAAFFREYLRKR